MSTKSSKKAATTSKVTNEIMESINNAELSQKEFDCIHAMLSSTSLTKAWKRSPYKSYEYFRKKQRQLEPLLNTIYAKLREQAIGNIVLAAPKASDALVDMLDKLEGTTETERRKTAETILDRSLGKPLATVAVNKQTNSRIEITFPEWLPEKTIREGKTVKKT